jgi:hypothetical protein
MYPVSRRNATPTMAVADAPYAPLGAVALGAPGAYGSGSFEIEAAR